jgi:hypothetical protein
MQNTRLKTLKAGFDRRAFAQLLPATFDFDLSAAANDAGFTIAQGLSAIFLDPIIGGAQFGFYAGLPDLVVTNFTDSSGGEDPGIDGGYSLNVDFSNPYPASSGFLVGANFVYQAVLPLPDGGASPGNSGRVRSFQVNSVYDAWDGGAVDVHPMVLPPSDVRVRGLNVGFCQPGGQACTVTGDLALSWTPPPGVAADSYDVEVLAVLPRPPPAIRLTSKVLTLTVNSPELTVPQALLPRGFCLIRIYSHAAPGRSRSAPLFSTLPESRAPVLIPAVFDVR